MSLTLILISAAICAAMSALFLVRAATANDGPRAFADDGYAVVAYLGAGIFGTCALALAYLAGGM